LPQKSASIDHLSCSRYGYDTDRRIDADICQRYDYDIARHSWIFLFRECPLGDIFMAEKTPTGQQEMRTDADHYRQVQDGFATVLEAARFLNVSRAKVYLMMQRRELPYAKFGASRRIPRRSLMEAAAAAIVV